MALVAVFIVEIVVFLLLQIVFLFVFYRLVLRDLPSQINELLFERHLKNELTEIAKDTADVVRLKLMELEQERADVMVRYEGLKGKRLDITQTNERNGLKKSLDQLAKEINGYRTSIAKIYGSGVLDDLKRIERLKIVSAINRYLDGISKK